jgi:hypothetical protein
MGIKTSSDAKNLGVSHTFNLGDYFYVQGAKHLANGIRSAAVLMPE